MLTSRLELLLEFDKRTRIKTPAEVILRLLGGKIGEGKQLPEPVEPGATIRDEKGKVAIRWHYASCGIVHEDVENHLECLSTIKETLGKIDKVAPLGMVSSRIFRMVWIMPTPKYDFDSLQSAYRQAFIKDNPIFDNCFDSTVVVEMKRDRWVLHHQSGAMQPTQLQAQFRVFKIREGFPNTFVFLSTTITSKETVSYSIDEMGGFLQRSLELCKVHADQFEAIMGRIL